jgi:two-component system, OmpR family, osmolarity sensor histidine kinase EnvZ
MPNTRRHLRDYLPKGLYWRSLLIIVLPVALMQIILTVVFLDDHWRATSKRMGQGVAADVVMLIRLYEADPTPAHFEEVRQMAKAPLRLNIAIDRTRPLERPRCTPERSILDTYMLASLQSELQRPVFYDATCKGEFVEIRVPIAEGVLSVQAYRDRVQARSGPWFVSWIIGATATLLTVSLIFIRNQVRPIERLAEAMAQFGRTLEISEFRPRGAREVRQAAAAFIDMRDRLRRLFDQRAQLLAGVSHDLRTPLTRLKLQFSMMAPSPDLDAARADVTDMESTIDDYLAFVRGEWTETPAPVDLAAMVRDTAQAAERGGAKIEVNVSAQDGLILPGRSSALKRCLANLIDNASAHGDHVQVEAGRTGDSIIIAVDDDGPGIDPALYEDAFRPFSRLDETRTRHSKGVGLGLAIARDVARSHGGDINLARSALGGLRAVLVLPVRLEQTPPASPVPA